MNIFVKKCIGLLGKRKIADDIKDEITVLATRLVNSIGCVKDVKDVKDMSEIDPDKLFIINKFTENVKGNSGLNNSNKHCGSEGHALETMMGIVHNSKNEPDILGYEMKKESKKITFGDFSATEYLFSKNREIIDAKNNWKKDEHPITRKEFIKYCGTPNPLKNNRFSWSGNCVPKYGEWNSCGQFMTFNDELDLCIFYSFDRDKRGEKHAYPSFLQTGELVIAIWKKSKLEQNINNKYNKKGFFKCKKKMICMKKFALENHSISFILWIILRLNI